MKFLEPTRMPKVVYTDNSLEFGKSCEELSWNHCTSTPHSSETNGIAERAVRRVKKWTSAVLLQSGLDKEWWADSMECYCYLRHIQDLLSDGKTPYERRFGIPFNGPVIPFGAMVEYHPISAKDISRLHQFGPEVLPGIFLGYVLSAGGIWKGDVMAADIEELIGADGRVWTPRQEAQCKGSVNADERWHIYISQSQMDQLKPWRRSTSETTHLNQGSSWTRRGTRRFSRRIRRTLFSNTSSRWLNTGRCRSLKWFLSTTGDFIFRHHVEPRVKLYIPREESFPYSTEINWRYHNYTYVTGCDVGETNWWIQECGWRKTIIWCMDRVHKVHFYSTKGHLKDTNCQGRDLKRKQTTCRLDNVCPEMWKHMSDASKRKEKQKWAMCPVKLWKRIVGVMDPTKQKQDLCVFWKPVNPPDCVCKNLYQIVMKAVVQEKETIHCSITLWFTNWFQCLKQWRYPQQKQQWIKNGRDWKRFRRGTWQKSETNQRWSMKQGRRARKFILHH